MNCRCYIFIQTFVLAPKSSSNFLGFRPTFPRNVLCVFGALRNDSDIGKGVRRFSEFKDIRGSLKSGGVLCSSSELLDYLWVSWGVGQTSACFVGALRFVFGVLRRSVDAYSDFARVS